VTDEPQLLTFPDRIEWRHWLESHYTEATEVWLVLHKKATHKQTFSLDDAVEEALCFGWIDGKLKSLDTQRYSLRFSPRKAGSIWSLSNIRRARRLIDEGLMSPAGLEKVNEARQNGQWDVAIRREQTDVIPLDLEQALQSRDGGIDGYDRLPASRKKQLLYWLSSARRPETRQRRIEAIVRETSE